MNPLPNRISACLCLLLWLAAGAAAAGNPQQALQQENRRQQLDLELRQKQYLWQLHPLPPDQRIELDRRLREQQRSQRLLQQQQQSEAARRLQRRQIMPAPPGAVMPGYDPLRFQREQQQQQLRFNMERRAWPYR